MTSIIHATGLLWQEVVIITRSTLISSGLTLKIEVSSSVKSIFFSEKKMDFENYFFSTNLCSIYFFKNTKKYLRFLESSKIDFMLNFWVCRPPISVHGVENIFRSEPRMSSKWPRRKCRRDRLGSALGHHEPFGKAIEHPRMAEPLRRAATVSL